MRNIFKFLCLVLLLFFMDACVNKDKIFKLTKEKSIAHNHHNKEQIEDLKTISQDINTYSTKVKSQYISTLKKYKKYYFRVWNIDKITIKLKNAMWANEAYSSSNAYGENLQPLSKNFFNNILNNSNFDKFATINKKAISLKELNIRAMPTTKPVFLNPNKAGEGFPFDYLQNSTIAPNKPLFVSHYSKNREWVFVECSFTYGWVKSDNIVFIDKKDTDIWQKAKQIFITKENVPIYAKDKNFLFKSKIGMMLPLIDGDKNSYRVLSISSYKKNEPLFLKSKLSKSIANKGILKFNSKNINKILSEVSKTNYGWGGMYSQRDCSSTLRDFYAPFGLWLPRNSYQQSKRGSMISLRKLSDTDKIEKIKQNAIPFKTLLYKKGHIGMYVGVINDEIIIFQNVWGVKTKKNDKEGRFIIGKPIFSTLEVGKNLKEYDKEASMLRNLRSMTKL